MRRKTHEKTEITSFIFVLFPRSHFLSRILSRAQAFPVGPIPKLFEISSKKRDLLITESVLEIFDYFSTKIST